jgi:hypothetical protein
MSYVDSTKYGVLASTATYVYSKNFDDKFQAWLADALDCNTNNVKPMFREFETAISTNVLNVFFEFYQIEFNGMPYDVEETDDHLDQAYEGTAHCRVKLIGENSREKAFLLHDLIYLSQNVDALQKFGLSINEAQIIEIDRLAEGHARTPMSTVDLTLDYSYVRRWSIKSLVSAPTEIQNS